MVSFLFYIYHLWIARLTRSSVNPITHSALSGPSGIWFLSFSLACHTSFLFIPWYSPCSPFFVCIAVSRPCLYLYLVTFHSAFCSMTVRFCALSDFSRVAQTCRLQSDSAVPEHIWRKSTACTISGTPLPSLFFRLLDAVSLLTICHEKARGDSVRRKDGGKWFVETKEKTKESKGANWSVQLCCLLRFTCFHSIERSRRKSQEWQQRCVMFDLIAWVTPEGDLSWRAWNQLWHE